MFDFKEFPAKIKLEVQNSDGTDVILEREVEVFGQLKIGLIAYRESDNFDPSVRLMPVSEFNERFEDYVLVEE